MRFLCDDKRHLICEPFSIENLHKMATELNIHRCWYHKGKFPHYDIPKKRIQEITEKCDLINSRELLMIIKNNLK
jgi:hypothetical protein